MGNSKSRNSSSSSNKSGVDRKSTNKSKSSSSSCSRKEITFLLLGTKNSGKSTIHRQIKFLQEKELSIEERLAYKPLIYQNILKCIKSIIGHMFLMQISLENWQRKLDVLDVFSAGDFLRLSPALKRLWHDDSIQVGFMRSSRHRLDDSIE